MPSIHTRYAVLIAFVFTVAFGVPARFASAAGAVRGGISIADVELTQGGRLEGQVVNAQALAQSGEVVVIRHHGEEIARVATDEAGLFEVTGLRGGVYEVTTNATTAVYRAWAPETAPPGVSDRIVMVNDETIVRGQSEGARSSRGGLSRLLFNPITLTLAIAAAIAIPVTLHNINNDNDSAS